MISHVFLSKSGLSVKNNEFLQNTIPHLRIISISKALFPDLSMLFCLISKLRDPARQSLNHSKEWALRNILFAIKFAAV